MGFKYYSLGRNFDTKSYSFHNTIIREYDIRGIYNETLFDSDAEILGNLFNRGRKNKTVNVDMMKTFIC